MRHRKIKAHPSLPVIRLCEKKQKVMLIESDDYWSVKVQLDSSQNTYIVSENLTNDDGNPITSR